ncbi:MAG TPA: hypothetical protein VHL77_06800, partial [Ferruginibacter sp.]|nr:hypothetical protein [Ferruginibacter sp.]
MLTLTPKPGVELLLVEVPNDAERIETSVQDDSIPCVTYFSADNLDPTVISLPPGSWTFIATTDTLTEEVASKCVLSDNSKLGKGIIFWEYVLNNWLTYSAVIS